jgi:hypothetical protein
MKAGAGDVTRLAPFPICRRGQTLPTRRASGILLLRYCIYPIATMGAFLAAVVGAFTPGTAPVSGLGVQWPPETRVA